MGWKSVKTVDLNDMQNTEWYKKTELDYDASGRWWADGYNEALSIGLSYGDDGVDVNFIDQLLAHHRKMIVKEIREEVKKQYKESRERFAEGKIGNERVNAMVDTVLSLHCLKENE